MNQILVSEKLYVTPDMKRKKKVSGTIVEQSLTSLLEEQEQEKENVVL